MLNSIMSFIIKQLTDMGLSGVLVAVMGCAVYVIWKELQAERRRSEDLVEKMQDLSKDTMTMIERITGR